MAADKATVLAELAKGNPVDLEKIATVDRQFAELERAGIVRPSGFRVYSPLGHPAIAQRHQVLANTAVNTNRK